MTTHFNRRPTVSPAAGMVRTALGVPRVLALDVWLEWLLCCVWLGCLVGSQGALGAEDALSPGDRFQDCGDCPEMVVVPAGQFVVDSTSSEEGPQPRVRIAKPFAVGIYEVTFDEWDACVFDGGCAHQPTDRGWGRGRRPVINVSWNDARQYVGWLSDRSGKAYRLLSESEWKYVSRAGTEPLIDFGTEVWDWDIAKIIAEKPTVPVGSSPANRFGVHDVRGNVVEWVQDCWNGSYDGTPRDGGASESGDCGKRVVLGSDRFSHARGLRKMKSLLRTSGGKLEKYCVIGFRVARTLSP